MAKKAEYRSAVRSRRLIREAYLALMQEKELEKITVTDVVTRADINRGTFYAHYADTHAVIEQIENEIIDKMVEVLHGIKPDSMENNLQQLLQEAARYLSEDVEFYRILIGSKGAATFLEKLKALFVTYMMDNRRQPETKNHPQAYSVHIHFVAGGIVNVFQRWFGGELDGSLEGTMQALSKAITL